MPELPSRDDAVAAWLKRWREKYDDETKHFNDFGSPYYLIDEMLDEYRLHADTGTPLDQHACDGPHCPDQDRPGCGGPTTRALGGRDRSPSPLTTTRRSPRS